MSAQVTKTRGQILGNVARVVVQVGASVLAELPVARIRALAGDIAALRNGGIDLVLVASGALLLGRKQLGIKRQPRQLPLLRAAAAVGGIDLAQAYREALAPFGVPVAQASVTGGDLGDHTRFLRLRHTVMSLLDYGVVPLVAENPALAEEACSPARNDLLAARVPRLVEADLLVMLTAAEGIYDLSPRRGGKVIHQVDDLDALAKKIIDPTGKPRIQDFLVSKIRAAQEAALYGVPTVLASGLRHGALSELLHDDTVGTLLLPDRAQRSRKQWIAHDLSPSGTIRVSDEGKDAIVDTLRSLLVTHVQLVEGDFSAGHAVRVMDTSGHEFARGLAGYAASELDRIKGLDTADVEKALEGRYGEEAIRRDDLVVL